MEIKQGLIFCALSLLAVSSALAKDAPASMAVKSAVAPSTDLPECKKGDESAEMNILFAKLSGLKVGETQSWVSLDVGKCYAANQKVKLFTIQEESALIYKRTRRGEVLILNAQRENWDAVKLRPQLLLTTQDKTRIEDHLRRRDNKKNQNVWVIQFTLTSLLDYNPQGGGVPLQHPRAKAVSLKELEVAATAGKKIYDLRPKKVFDKGHFKSAIHVPLKNAAAMSASVLPASRLREFDIPKKIFPDDKQQEIYILSYCSGEFSSYNLITLLRDRGYKNIKWLRDGMSSQAGFVGCKTPKALAAVGTATASDIANTIDVKTKKSKIALFDVRGDLERRKFKSNILGSTRINFKQKVNALNIPTYRSRKMTAANLAAKKESLDNVQLSDKGKPVILIGENEYDWRPYKAAILLKSQGFKDVRWYRGGMADWRMKYIFDRNRYPLKPEPEFPDLDL